MILQITPTRRQLLELLDRMKEVETEVKGFSRRTTQSRKFTEFLESVIGTLAGMQLRLGAAGVGSMRAASILQDIVNTVNSATGFIGTTMNGKTTFQGGLAALFTRLSEIVPGSVTALEANRFLQVYGETDYEGVMEQIIKAADDAEERICTFLLEIKEELETSVKKNKARSVMESGNMQQFPRGGVGHNGGASSNRFPTVMRALSSDKPRELQVVLKDGGDVVPFRFPTQTRGQRLDVVSAFLTIANGVGDLTTASKPWVDRIKCIECHTDLEETEDCRGTSDLQGDPRADLDRLCPSIFVISNAEATLVDAGKAILHSHKGLRVLITELGRTDGAQPETPTLPFHIVANVKDMSWLGYVGQPFVNEAIKTNFELVRSRTLEGLLRGIAEHAVDIGLIRPDQQDMIKAKLVPAGSTWVAVPLFYTMAAICNMKEREMAGQEDFALEDLVIDAVAKAWAASPNSDILRLHLQVPPPPSCLFWTLDLTPL
jgi:hypothetical protein